MDSQPSEPGLQEEQKENEEITVDENHKKDTQKEKSSPDREGKSSKRRHKSHKGHRHSSRRHRHRSSPSSQDHVPVLDKEEQISPAKSSRRGEQRVPDAGNLEDGELEDGEIDDEVQGEDGPPRLSPQMPFNDSSKDAEMESEGEESDKKKSPDKKADAGSGDENDDKKKAKKRKHEKRKKKKESRAKEKSKKKKPKYTDHDNVEEDNGQQESWMRKGRSPNGHSFKGHDHYKPDRSPPGPYDSPYESPPGPYDSPSDEDEYGPPSKMMRREVNKHRMLDMLGQDYLDPLPDDGDDEMYSRGRKMGRNKQKKMEKAQMFRDMQRSQGRPERGGNMMQGGSKQKCKFFMEGKCAKGHNCTFSHDFRPPRKSEVCKFYISDTCAKGKDCLYMHGDYPCKFFHKGLACAGDNCKFSHEPLDDHTRPIFDKIRDEDQDFVTVMLQQTHQLPYPMPGQEVRSPNKNPNHNKRGGGSHGHSNQQQAAPPLPPPHHHQQQQQQSELKKIPSLFEIEVFPPGKRPGESGGEEGDSPSGLSSPPAEDDHSESGDSNMPRERQASRDPNMSPAHHAQVQPPPIGGPMGARPPPPMGAGMGGPPHGMMGGPPPPNMMGGPPPPHLGGPPPMGMRPRFYTDMNASGRPPPPPMMAHQPGILGAPPPMLRPPHMNYPPPGEQQGPNDYYRAGPGGDQLGPHDSIQSPEHDKHFNQGDMYGIEDQLREMREMSGNPHIDLAGGQPEFPAHLAPKQRELFMRIQQQQRQNVPEPASNSQQQDKVDVDDNWYSSDEEESGAPKSNLANIIKTLNQNQQAPPQPPPSSGVPFDIAKVLNVIQGVQPQQAPQSGPAQQPPTRRDPRQTQAGQSRTTDPRLQRSDPRTAQRPDPRNEAREQRLDSRPDHRLETRPDPRAREPPTIPIEKTVPFRSNSEEAGAGGDSKFNEAGIRIHNQTNVNMGGVPYQLYKMTISPPTIPHHVNPNDPKYKEDPRIQKQLSGRGYQESRPVRRQSSQSDPRASMQQQQQQPQERYDPRVLHSPSHTSGGSRIQDPRMQKASSVGVAVKQDVDMRLERGRIQDPRMSRTLSEPFGVPIPTQQPRLPSSPQQDSDMRPLALPTLNSGPRDSPPMPSLPPFIPPKPSAPLHKSHGSSPSRSPRADMTNTPSDSSEKPGEKVLSHRNDPRFRKKPKTDAGPASASPLANNDPRHRKSDPRRAFEHRSPLDSGSKSVSEPSFGSFNPAKNPRSDNNDPLRHGDKDERDFSKGNGFAHRQQQQPPRGPARHIGMPQISMPTRHSSIRSSSPNPAQLAQTGPLVRTGGLDAQAGVPDDDPSRSMKDVFKTIDPTASPFC